MPRWTFVDGLDGAAQEWGVSGTFRAMLVRSTWTPDPTVDVFVSDIAADESSATGYARQTLTGLTRTIQDPASSTESGYVVFDCADPTFGVLSGGQTVSYVVVFQFVTGDADSPLVAAFTVAYTADGVTECEIVVSPNGVLRIGTVCSNGDFDAAPSEGS